MTITEWTRRHVLGNASMMYADFLVPNADGSEYTDEIKNLRERTDWIEPALDYARNMTRSEAEEFADAQYTPMDWEGVPLAEQINATLAADRDAARDFCDRFCVEPYYTECVSYWFVSQDLGRWLNERGAPCEEVSNCWIWGRSTMGQAIEDDGVIRAIFDSLEQH